MKLYLYLIKVRYKILLSFFLPAESIPSLLRAAVNCGYLE